ncbi:MAG: LysM peptidoglycan-binding domain-containing protein [Akkermansiaceae bacterium]
MKTLLISTALFTAPLIGSVTAQTTTGTLTSLIGEQERQIQELKTEVSSLRSLLNLERRKNGKVALAPTTTLVSVSTPSAASHTVKSGETFSSVSRKYGVSVSSLINANPKVKPSNIAIGQKLVIPQVNTTATASTPKVKTQTAKRASTVSHGSTYKVNKGDTFYKIAQTHNISLSELSAANPSVNPKKLKIGQTVRLTKSATLASKAAQPKRSSSAAYKPLPKADTKAAVKSSPKPKATPAPEKTESYVEQSGKVARTVPVSHEMTYGAFAKQHGTTISVLNTLNGLDLPADEPMAAGSELFIPNK